MPARGDLSRLDTSVPHPARVYDYYLGGKDNFAADRAAAEEGLKAFPGVLQSVRANRAFLERAVRYLTAEAGMRGFLDIGTGLPSANNTHEVAQSIAPESRIAYVDNDRCKPDCAHTRGRSGCLRPHRSRNAYSGPERSSEYGLPDVGRYDCRYPLPKPDLASTMEM